MIVLKVIDSYREELNQKCIVICTYKLLSDNSEVDCITLDYKNEYPQFEMVEVIVEPDDI